MVCVSVILPTFNRARCLDAAIRSVLLQSFGDIELIVVDDCSTDETKALVRGIRDSRLRYIRRDVNGGAAAARNTGIAAATGEFIAFQDSDDIWLPGKLDLQLRLMRSAPAHVAVVTGVKLMLGSVTDRIAVAPDPATALRFDEDQYGHLLMENRISVQNALFRRGCLPTTDWFDTRTRANEDWELAVRLSKRWKILEHPDLVVVAFRSPDSISSCPSREAMGIARVIRNNAAMRSRYPRQFALLYFRLGRSRWANGKRRSSLKLMASGIASHPSLLGSILAGKLKRAFRSQALRVAGASVRSAG